MTVPVIYSEKVFTFKDLSQAHLDLISEGLDGLADSLEQPRLGTAVDLIRAIKALDE